jgi:thiol-disulfide isomerase/thioredoxin
MANLVDYLTSKIKPYTFYITIFVVALIFIIISIYVYRQYYNSTKDSSKLFKDVANNGAVKSQIDIMLFHVDWCPHCHKALPEWQSFCDEYNNKIVNGYQIQCERDGINCTDETDPKVAAIINENKIESYPTVILFKDNKRYDFDAKITRNSLEQFVQSVTQ